MTTTHKLPPQDINLRYHLEGSLANTLYRANLLGLVGREDGTAYIYLHNVGPDLVYVTRVLADGRVDFMKPSTYTGPRINYRRYDDNDGDGDYDDDF